MVAEKIPEKNSKSEKLNSTAPVKSKSKASKSILVEFSREPNRKKLKRRKRNTSEQRHAVDEEEEESDRHRTLAGRFILCFRSGKPPEIEESRSETRTTKTKQKQKRKQKCM